MSRQLVVHFALALVAAPLGAQQSASSPQVAVGWGAPVRVYTPHSFVAGRLIGLSPTALIVASEHRTDTVMRSDVMELHVRHAAGWTTVAPAQLPVGWDVSAGPVTADGRVVVPGSVLRVNAGGRRVKGALLEWRRDTLVLAGSGSTTHAAPMGPDTRIEILSGRRGQATGGFVIGFIVGAVGGAAGGSAGCEGLNNLGFGGREQDCAGFAAAGGMLGGLLLGGVGAAVGSAIRSERWVDVPPDSVRSYLATRAR